MSTPPIKAAPLQLPTAVVILIGCVLGVIAGLLHTFDLGLRPSEYLQGIITLFGVLGISPLVGSEFRNALHLPALAALLIGFGLAALSIFAPTFSVGSVWLGVIQGVIAFAATVGFGPLPLVPALRYGIIR